MSAENRLSQKNIIIYLILAVLMIISLYNHYINIAVLVICAGIIFTSNRDDIFCLCTFLVPFTPIFKITLGGFALFNIVIVIAIVRLLILNNGRINNGPILIILIFYVALISINNDLNEVLSFFIYIVFSVIIFDPFELSFRKTIDCLAIGILITSGIALLKDYLPNVNTIISDATLRYSPGVYYYRFAGLEGNPNYFTMIVSVVISGLVVFIAKGESKVRDYIFLVLLIVLGLMTASQSFVVGLIVTVVLLIFSPSDKTAKNSKIVAWIGLLICAVAIVVLLNSDATEALRFRFENLQAAENANDITNGRAKLWGKYFEYLFLTPLVLLFGSGIGKANLPGGASHNFFIDIIYHLGIIGGSLYVYLLKSVFSTKKIRLEKPRLYNYIPFVVFFVRCFARNLIGSEQLPFMFVICSLALIYGIKLKDKESVIIGA